MSDLEQHFSQIITSLGEDLNREGLKKTPQRAAKALQFLTQGYQQDIQTIINGALFDTDMEELVVLKNIELYSLCEHHLLPFIGKCHVAYIPKGKILGLSKIARVVELFARRLQVQETLTKQIAECLMEVTQAAGVGVIIEAQHLCMMMRGIEKQNSIMNTSVMLGELRKNSNLRAEFLSALAIKN